jgi:hypothetical protein
MPSAKYLHNYAEPEAQQNFNFIRSVTNCLVIPCRNESIDLLEQLKKLLKSAPSTLVILVINQPESQIDNAANKALSMAAHDQLSDSVLVIDRFSPGRRIKDKQGVGLARKIGCDIACQLIHQGIVTSKWIHTSDADVCWPNDYFSATARLNNVAAANYPFTHIQREGSSGLPIALYELSLRYYVAGLNHAGSSYCYHTVGSTLAINADNYAMVRGFPKRNAGEDFHILNKLRKTGVVASLTAPNIAIFDRESNRAPFGTGPAVAKIGIMDNAIDKYVFYHPQCFELLKTWLDLSTQLFFLGNTTAVLATIETELNPTLVKGLKAAKIEPLIEHCFKQAKTNMGFVKQLQDGFDALTTLRLIHFLREHKYPSINLTELCTLSSWFALAVSIDYEQKPWLTINQQSITLLNQQLAASIYS